MSDLKTRLKELRKKNKLTQLEMAQLLRQKYDLKTDRVMISKWETGYQTPEIYTITCIADLFRVSIDYLNGKDGPEKEQLENEPPLSDSQKRILALSTDLPDEDIKKVIDYAELLKKARNP